MSLGSFWLSVWAIASECKRGRESALASHVSSAKIQLSFQLALGIFIGAHSLTSLSVFHMSALKIPLISPFGIMEYDEYAHTKRLWDEPRHIRKLWKHEIGKDKTHTERARKKKQHHTYLSSICDMKFKLAVAESVLFTRSLCKIHVAFSRALLLPAHTRLYSQIVLLLLLYLFHRNVFLWSNVAQNPNFLSSNEYWVEGFWFDANIKFGWVRDCFF